LLKVLIHYVFLLRDSLRNKSLVGRRRAAPRFRGASEEAGLRRGNR